MGDQYSVNWTGNLQHATDAGKTHAALVAAVYAQRISLASTDSAMQPAPAGPASVQWRPRERPVSDGRDGDYRGFFFFFFFPPLPSIQAFSRSAPLLVFFFFFIAQLCGPVVKWPGRSAGIEHQLSWQCTMSVLACRFLRSVHRCSSKQPVLWSWSRFLTKQSYWYWTNHGRWIFTSKIWYGFSDWQVSVGVFPQLLRFAPPLSSYAKVPFTDTFIISIEIQW